MSDHERIVLLNRVIAKTVSHAPPEYKPPLVYLNEILQLFEKRRRNGVATEFFGIDDIKDDKERMKAGIGSSCIRLSQLRFDEEADGIYAVMLFEFIDHSRVSFPVVHQEKYVGREITGDEMERGATSAHVIIRLPRPELDFDDGVYRCAFESVHPVTRLTVQRFLNRQIRREGNWIFEVVTGAKGKKAKSSEYKYYPKLDLVADVGRKLANFGADGRLLTHIVFTKRSERQSIGQPTSVIHEDVFADVELKVSARQAPEEPNARRSWVDKLKDIYLRQGYEAKLYYRHAGGGILQGSVHRDVASAADLVMCPKEIITLSKIPKQWSARVNPEVVELLKQILKKDALWESAA